MKRLCSILLFALLFSPASTGAQAKEPLFFEQSVFSIKIGSDWFLYTAKMLFRNPNQDWGDPIIQTVCMPSFEPSWDVHIYHPMYDFIGSSGLREYHEDTLKFIVCYEQVDKRMAWLTMTESKARKSKTLVKIRQIPASYAREIEKAFVATLALARWPTGRDLVAIDGTDYHFLVHHKETDIHMWAQCHSPQEGTKSRKLAALSEVLRDFAQAKSDSIADQTLQNIHFKCVELLE